MVALVFGEGPSPVAFQVAIQGEEEVAYPHLCDLAAEGQVVDHACCGGHRVGFGDGHGMGYQVGSHLEVGQERVSQA